MHPSRVQRPQTSTLFPYTTLFRSHERNLKSGLDQWGVTYIGSDLVGQILKEFWPDFKRHVLHKRDDGRSEEHTSELQSPMYLVCRLLLEKKNLSGGKEVAKTLHDH